ncbi:MAG: GTP cyclohydrolase I [Crenarchaeota archaeon]|nr:GTP cyclohydrolase I [Thermoproteota archaeon]
MIYTKVEKPDLEKVEEAARNFLLALNLDLSDPHLQDTPKRIAKMYVNELFKSKYNDPPKVTVFPYDSTYNTSSNTYPSLVVSDYISVKSMCSHHFVPFYGNALVAYIPGKNIAGLSKFARIVDYFARRPQVQERLCQQVCDYLVSKLEPAFLYVGMKCRHQCMICRGVNEHKSSMVTYSVYVDPESRDVLAVDSILTMLGDKVMNIDL